MQKDVKFDVEFSLYENFNTLTPQAFVIDFDWLLMTLWDIIVVSKLQIVCNNSLNNAYIHQRH